MAYTQVRYIGYQVATIGRTGRAAVYGIPPGVVNNPPGLNGVTPHLPPDARIRVERLVGAMCRAHAQIQTSDNVQTLKVFIAPEFYFRPDNTEVSYSMDQYRAIKNVLRATIGNDTRFKDWLVIPGTILWKMTSGDSRKSKRSITNPNRRVYFNTSLYIKQSTNPRDKTTRVIEKCEASTIDGIPTGRHGGTYPDNPDRKSAPVEYPQYNTFGKAMKHIVKTCGLTIGIEICLEHYRKILKQVLCNMFEGFGRADDIDLHLLTAGGMHLQSDAIAAKRNGYVMRNDGSIDERRGEKAIQMHQVTSYDSTHGATLLTSRATTQSMNSFNPRCIPIGATDDLYLPPPPGCARRWTTQQIVIYPSLPLS